MGAFDNYNYEINEGLPEFWKQDVFLTPIERFSALLMRDTVQRFMEKMGVLQPFMVWKTLPEEYNWQWGFEDFDLRLANEDENANCNQTLQLSPDNHIVAQLPLTKRNVHGYIVIELSSMSFSDTTEYTPIEELVIKNADQTLKIKNIDSKTTIEIYTEDNVILLNDAEPKKGQIEGSLNIIKRSPREDPNDIDDPLDINEICEVEIYISSGETAYCDLYIELIHPVYVTEQNIRLHSLSAFPLEYVRLYGYMCHKYNNKHQWVYLWEKTYAYQDRIVYDKIAKQYDCEIFYIEVKMYGLPAPFYIGFPATRSESVEGVFSLNETLDYWGGVLHIPRRNYKTDIPEEQERYCFPKYYAYSIEQDYPYEQRLLNEYKYNEDWQDFINIKDTEGTDLALVRCKDPYIENIYMYTETILPTDILSSRTTIQPNCIKELNNNNESLQQAEWDMPENLRYDSKSYSIVNLNNQDEENITNQSYKSNVLALEFDLSSLPQNANIRGMELKFKGVSNTHADNIFIDERSFLRYTKKVLNDESGNHIWKDTSVPLSNYFDLWRPDNASYVLGDKDSIFGLDEIIDRDSIEKGYLRDGIYQDNKIRIDIGFSNQSEYLDLIIKLFNIQLTVYLDIIKEDIDVQINIPHKTIIYDNDSQTSSTIDIGLSFTNNGDIKEVDYNSFIIIPPELCFLDDDGFNHEDTIREFYLGNITKNNELLGEDNYHVLHVGETWPTTITIGANQNPIFKSGRYDIICICGEYISTEEIFVYDKDYATYNNISQDLLEENIELSFVESEVSIENGYATAHIQLTKDGRPYPYQYVSINDNYYILDENGQAEVKVYFTNNNGGYITASYSSLSAKCEVLPPTAIILTYDTQYGDTVIIQSDKLESSSDIYIDWGDGLKELCNATMEHTYESEDIYQVKIQGDITILKSNMLPSAQKNNLIEIQSSSLTIIESGVFNQCSHLSMINCPNVIELGSGAFYKCTELVDITLPKVINLGDSVFGYCSNLITINLPNATTFGNSVFEYCNNLHEVYLPNATTFKSAVFQYCNSLQEISLPNVTTLENATFHYCSNLRTLNLPSAITLGAAACYGCTQLTNVSIPKAQYIDGGTFQDCSNLKNIVIKNTERINGGAFSSSGLEEITILEDTEIVSGAFYNCSHLKRVIMPKVTEIPAYAFAGYPIEYVDMSSVKVINSSSFASTRLTEITLPDTLESLGADAFYNASILTTIRFLSDIPPSIQGRNPANLVISNRDCKIYVPCNTLQAYTNTLRAPNYIQIVEECE